MQPIWKFVVLASILAAAVPALGGEETVRLKDAPGHDLVVVRCSLCHSLDYIPMNSPFLDEKGWDGEVSKMIKSMGAPITAEETPVLVRYLSGSYGAVSRQGGLIPHP